MDQSRSITNRLPSGDDEYAKVLLDISILEEWVTELEEIGLSGHCRTLIGDLAIADLHRRVRIKRDLIASLLAKG